LQVARNADNKASAGFVAGEILDQDLSVVCIYDLFSDGKPKPCPRGIPDITRPEEVFEDVRQVLRRDTGTFVLD